jgi:hypothetical protein
VLAGTDPRMHLRRVHPVKGLVDRALCEGSRPPIRILRGVSRAETAAELTSAAARSLDSSAWVVQRPVLRRWRRCTVTIEKPTPIRSRPKPTVQRRSKPVNGSDFALLVVGLVLVVGVVLFVAGSVVFVGVLLSFDGEVPVLGVEVVGGGGVWL